MTESAPSDRMRVPKAAELVAAHLRRQIVLGERAEGEQLPPEPELMRELGVSRPTLRQALRILASEHLVRVHRGRGGGTRVSGPATETATRYLNHLLSFQGSTLDDVHRAQLLIEPAAVAELAGRLDAATITELRRAGSALREATDAAAAGRLDARFHLRLVELTRNRSLMLFARLMSGQLDLAPKQPPAPEPHDARDGERDGERAATVEEHERLIDLLQAGASRQATLHWREHLHATHERRRLVIDTGAPLRMMG